MINLSKHYESVLKTIFNMMFFYYWLVISWKNRFWAFSVPEQNFLVDSLLFMLTICHFFYLCFRVEFINMKYWNQFESVIIWNIFNMLKFLCLVLSLWKGDWINSCWWWENASSLHSLTIWVPMEHSTDGCVKRNTTICCSCWRSSCCMECSITPASILLSSNHSCWAKWSCECTCKFCWETPFRNSLCWSRLTFYKVFVSVLNIVFLTLNENKSFYLFPFIAGSCG